MNQIEMRFWSTRAEEVFRALGTFPHGLTSDVARNRLERFGYNVLGSKRRKTTLSLLLSQFKSPIVLILLCATCLSFFLHDPSDALIIFTIVIISGLLGFVQEHGAQNAVEKLLETLEIKSTVLRNKKETDVPAKDIVPGDVVVLNAGASVPADCLLLESKDLFVNEAPLTGETFPVEKIPAILPEETPLGRRVNSLYMGTHVVSGSARAVVVGTGEETEFGKISGHLKMRPPETEFQRGIRRFGYLLLELTLMLVIGIFAVNVYLLRPVMESFLFSLALAVGLTPQLLPVIISINLAHGARGMAAKKVIVKRLSSIENFGSMDVLCSDKTGTLTEGAVRVHSSFDAEGNESEKCLHYAYLNSTFETGFVNPIDEAVRNFREFDIEGRSKLDEVPYDFIRKRLSILVTGKQENEMIIKGAFSSVLGVCTRAELAGGKVVDISLIKDKTGERYERLGSEGFRLLGVAYRRMGKNERISKEDEKDMIFLGFVSLYDPLKAEIGSTISRLNELGVSLKIITGDSRFVAFHVADQIELAQKGMLSGAEIQAMSDEALMKRVNEADVFAEVEPNQKERIILALHKSGRVVGYMGDGINDASALHAADVGISVDSAVDVAKEAADIVLLEKDLGVLVDGIQEGRRTFSNTLKYVFMATSANFGNMFSMAGASLFLPFLPLLPKQILLTNLLTDVPEMTIAADNVDQEMVERPRRWNIRFIRNFMLTFGILSSFFDYVTFGVLKLLLNATTEQFRTGWFLESVVSATLIVLVVRTRKFFLKSKPHRYLALATLLVVLLTMSIPFISFAKLFGFTKLPLSFFGVLSGIVLLYVCAAEVTKKLFYRRVKDI
jgi:Mg2+-importing ATPase